MCPGLYSHNVSPLYPDLIKYLVSGLNIIMPFVEGNINNMLKQQTCVSIPIGSPLYPTIIPLIKTSPWYPHPHTHTKSIKQVPLQSKSLRRFFHPALPDTMPRNQQQGIKNRFKHRQKTNKLTNVSMQYLYYIILYIYMYIINISNIDKHRSISDIHMLPTLGCFPKDCLLQGTMLFYLLKINNSPQQFNLFSTM